jgi:hypothetical protein
MQAVHSRPMHAEQARDDPRLTTRQRSAHERAQDFSYLPLVLARRLLSKPRATLQLNAVARILILARAI